jgi:hypothetical protein
MAVEDLMESKVVLTAGATATALSPKVRGVVRQGLVYAVAGAVTAGNTALGLGRGAVRVVPGVGTSAKENGHKPRTSSGSSGSSASSGGSRSSSARSRSSQGGGSSS